MRIKAPVYKQFIITASKLIGGTFEEKEEKVYGVTISSKPEVFVPYTYLSSGQRAMLPLIASIVFIGAEPSSIDSGIPFNSAVLEEPEAHVYPKNQFLLMKLLAAALYLNESTRFVLTTHSPYILSSINALVEYGLATKNGNKVEALRKYTDLIPMSSEKEQLGIYHLRDGIAISLRNEDSGRFDTSSIDSVSDEINEVFDESCLATEKSEGDD